MGNDTVGQSGAGRQPFIKFSVLRVGFCVIFCAFTVFLSIFAMPLYYFYINSGNTYVRGVMHNLVVHFLDVGHGDCTIVEFPDGRTAVIDVGSVYYGKKIEAYIKTRIKPKNKTIDYMILTHPDADHVGGLGYLASKFRIKRTFDYTNFPVAPIAGGGYTMRFGAVKPLDEIDFYEPNDLSPIITIEYANQIFVFTGDASSITESIFVAQSAELFTARTVPPVVYLSVGHHGSDTSTAEFFLNLVNPTYAIISAGTYSLNAYDHPRDTVIARLTDPSRDLKNFYVTRISGDIVVRCNGDNAKFFYGFDNPVGITPLFIIVFMSIIAVSFISYPTNFVKRFSIKKVLKTQDIVV
jgi:beta-lactamase superfamily II metal-dependent hydrolase